MTNKSLAVAVMALQTGSCGVCARNDRGDESKENQNVRQPRAPCRLPCCLFVRSFVRRSQ